VTLPTSRSQLHHQWKINAKNDQERHRKTRRDEHNIKRKQDTREDTRMAQNKMQENQVDRRI
jgi:hypothetical protein